MSTPQNSERFSAAIAAFDRANADDPNLIEVGGAQRPRELVDAERLSAWVERLAPDASEALRLASRCQHIRRFESPRDSFPAGRVGYLQWRTQLGRFHADTAARLLAEAGYEQPLIDEVRRINLKQGLHSNPDTQTIEDALCLVFLEFELEEFRAKHPDDKVIDILRKTWKKMSEPGRAAALALPLGREALALVTRALSPVG